MTVLRSGRQMVEALTEFLPSRISRYPFLETCQRRARSSGVFLCFVSLDAQRNEGAGQGHNPATLSLLCSGLSQAFAV